MSVYTSLRHFIWGKRPATAEERKLLIKLDVMILSYVCISYFTNYLDRANLNNAYVSGMKEDIHYKGNDFTYANSLFTAGYIVGQLPSALILSSNRVPPRVWLPGCVFAWGVLTLGLAFVNNVQTVWGIRFVQGVFEASTFSGTHFILGSWYKEEELGKRTAIFTSAAQLGSLFSGVMQGRIHTTLDGRNGLAGWRWLFIIDAVITIPVAFYGYLCFPDTPHSTKSYFLTESERQLCVSRLPPHKPVKMTWTSLKGTARRALVGWRWYLFSALFMVSATAFEASGIYAQMGLWLKAEGGYTVEQINYYPTIVTAVAIVATIILTMYSDATRNRFIVNPIMFVSVLIMSIILLIWDVPKSAKFFAYSVGGIGYAGQASNFAWANQLCRDDDALRAITLASMNLFSNVWALWYGIVVFPVVQAPRFKNGQIATIVCGAASVGIAFAIVLLSKKYYRDHPEEGGGGDGDDVVEYQSGRESGATADEAEKDAVDGEAVVYDVDK